MVWKAIVSKIKLEFMDYDNLRFHALHSLISE